MNKTPTRRDKSAEHSLPAFSLLVPGVTGQDKYDLKCAASTGDFELKHNEEKIMATVVGLFDNVNQAQTAVQELKNSGVQASEISVAMQQAQGGTTQTETVTDTSGGGGAVTGAIGGGVLGGLAGLLVGIGALAIPGVGPIVAAGPLATTLIGAGVGAAAGGLVGALVDAGVPEEEARIYETGVQRGGVLVTARVPGGQEQGALDILNRNGAHDIHNEAARYNDPNFRYGSTTGTDTTVHHDHGTRGVGSEAGGAAAGAIAGGALGAAVAGPLGVGLGAALGGAAGAAAGGAAKGDDAGEEVGSTGGAAAGAVTGAAAGAIGGPVGMAAGAAIGGAVGGAAGKGASDAAAEATDGDDDTVLGNNYDSTRTTYDDTTR